MKFFFALQQSHFISRVNYPNKAVSFFKIISPVRSNGCLSSNIPNIKLETKLNNIFITCNMYIPFMLSGSNIKSQRWCYLVYIFRHKFFYNRCFSSIIKSSIQLLDQQCQSSTLQNQKSNFLFLLFNFFNDREQSHFKLI